MATEVQDLTTIRLEQKSVPVVDSVRSIKIVDVASLASAIAGVQTIKALQSEITDTFGPLKTAADEAHKRIVATEKRLLRPLLDAERDVKNAITDFHDEQERQRQKREQELREAAARFARAAQEKALAAAEEQRKKLEAERAVKEAELKAARDREEEANRKAAESKLIDEAVALEEAGVSADEAMELLDAPLVVAELPPLLELPPVAIPVPQAIVVPIISVASTMPKIDGGSFRTDWSAEVVDKRALLRAVVEGTVPDLVLSIDMKFLNSQARLLKGELGKSFPGVRAVGNTNFATRKAS